MKNYYIQLSELRIAEARIQTLLEKKAILEAKITKVTGSMKEVVIFGGTSSDKMTDYVSKCEEIDKQIEEIKEEIKVIKKGLFQMEEILNNIGGLEEKIFRLYYIENKTPTQISYILPCGIATVYRYIKTIKKKCMNDKK